MTSIKQAYYHSLFQTTPLSILINPFYFARKGLHNTITDFSKQIATGKVLDVGCGKKPYQHLFEKSEYIGLEIDSEHSHQHSKADYFYSGNRFPFESDTFTAVVCNQVLEHIFEPSTFLSEINRCLQSGGHLLISVPFVWDEHEIPHDFARYSSFGLEYLLVQAGFKVIRHQKTISDIRVVFQMLAAYIYKTFLQQKSQLLQILLTFLFIFPINAIGEVLGYLLPSNKDLYLDNIVIAKKL